MSDDGLRVRLRNLRASAVGSVGEALVRAELEMLGWPMLRNVILADATSSVEIDHIVCASAAIIVVETKTYSGGVDGKTDSEFWKLSLRDGRCFDVPNAIRQNDAHVTVVRRVIYDSSVPVRGYIVNAGAGVFAPTLAEAVVSLRDLRSRLIEDNASRDGPEAGLGAAWQRLVVSASGGEACRRAHIARVSRRI